MLALETAERAQLLQRNMEVLEKARTLAELIATRAEDALVALRMDELNRMRAHNTEYSAMVCAYLRKCPGVLP
jgi:hypothetical protein